VLKSRYSLLDFRELLSQVLEDEGTISIILDDQRNVMEIDSHGDLSLANYTIFSWQILKTYNPDYKPKKSLENWVYEMTYKSEGVKKILSEWGIKIRSDWGILNKVSSGKMGRLSLDQQKILRVYHQVYRRDRRNSGKQRSKCSPPTREQLEEMIELLYQENIKVKQTEILLKKLKEMATFFREIEVTISLDIPNENGKVREIPYEGLSLEKLEENHLIEGIRQQFEDVLLENIQATIKQESDKLKKKNKDQLFLKGLLLYYQESCSLGEIAEILNISLDQAKRLFKPAKLVTNVRSKTVSYLCEFLIELGEKQGFKQLKQDPNSLNYLTQQVEEYLDQEVFNLAAMEIKAGKNRSFNSLYAKKLVTCLTSFS
jgi:hypothetical protein